MDDLRAFVAPFDPDAPLPAAPDPWDYMPMPDVRGAAPWAMHEMVAAEPALVTRIGRRLVADGSAAALATAIRATAAAGGPVIVTGCGTSEHAAMGVAAILRDAWRDAGLPGWGPVASQAFELALQPPAGGLVIGISHEGGTTATIDAMRAARGAGASTAVITGSAGSPAAAVAGTVLATVEMDRSWCHTVGYVSPLAAAAVTAELLAGRTPAPDLFGQRMAEGIEAAWAADTDGFRAGEDIGRAVADALHLVVVASGSDRVTARELVLKVEEAAYRPSAMRDLETFLHGHLPATGEQTAMVLILTEQDGLDARAARARQALAAAKVVGIRPGAILSAAASALVPDDLTPSGRVVVPDPRPMGGAAASLLGGAGPLQVLTLGVAERALTNPDPIRRDDATWRRAGETADAPSI